ncbi:hypothetical protein HK405_008921 [Cladochytrium tenue]|nr:hypothetical protein HK405_008921 [Cladochytrium tenue]
MAEVFGIVSGAVGIAAIFSTCIECFDYVEVGRSFGRDVKTNQLVLVLLQLRLSRWGDAVGIDNGDNPESLQLNNGASATSKDVDVAKDVLVQILVLLQDSQKVSRKYEVPAATDENLDVNEPLNSMCERMRKLAVRRQKKAGLVKLLKWAIIDHDRIIKLTEGIALLLDRLESVFPAPKDRLTARAEEDAEVIAAATVSTPPVLVDPRFEEAISQVKLLADKVDKALSLKLTSEAGIRIGSIVMEPMALMHNGDSVDPAWKGQTLLPQSNSSVHIGNLTMRGNAKVMNGTIFGSGKGFFD